MHAIEAKSESKGSRYCGACGALASSSARFCSGCGASLVAKNSISARSILVVGISATVLWFVGWQTQNHLTGVKPTADSNSVQDTEPVEDVYVDATLRKLKEMADAAPGEIGGWRVLADELSKRTGPRESPNRAVIFELMDVLGKILEIRPDDEQGLLSFANLSFNQLAFEKAVQYYERYLTKRPDDNDARVSYASSFTFLGMNERALAELDKVLAKSPKHFQSAAMKMVVLSQMGRSADADAQAEKAMALAPSDEARGKIQEFLKAVHEKAARAPAVSTAGGFEGVVEFVKSNSIAGPKVTRSEKDATGGGSIYFKEFPMEQMPPFAREKFLSGITARIKELGLPKGSLVRLVDDASGKEMAAVQGD